MFVKSKIGDIKVRKPMSLAARRKISKAMKARHAARKNAAIKQKIYNVKPQQLDISDQTQGEIEGTIRKEIVILCPKGVEIKIIRVD